MSRERVLIAGAGPVGLVAATLLAEAGIPVTLVEAERELPTDLRASTFHPPTLDMLDRLGLAAPLVEQGLICPQWQFRDRATGPVATFDLSLLKDETAHPFRLQCEQWRLARMLRDRLEQHPDVTLLYGARATAAEQDADGVRLTLTLAGGGEEVLEGRYLIGADGAHSAVRKAAGAVMEGQTIPELFLTLSTTFAYHEVMPDLTSIAYISDPQEWFVLLRTASLWRLLLPTPQDEPEDVMLSEARIQARMQEVWPRAGGYEIRHRTAYRVHERVADRYVSGRILLAGDAAHLNNPLGGMGMNGGVHDAFNLAEKLIAVWRGADPALFGRYERQRRKVALEVVQAQTLRNRATLNQRDPEVRRAALDDLRATAEDPARHKAYLMRSSMIASLRELDSVA
ncbi:FAD-dependent monooxygenase [Roseomonas sp. GC11]|uniref:FAD-dependent oxidoreductase n=1 Tax=Roseomonas sp. GC11 TaxID=2950546 RepID=UPI002109332E|nr:NAD(P)/FAD-dependent oxidoreductase [Roseomonas sp. GC11]MCQ4161228.1 FAD-dependent monooxygenase [Roseomonas sp. GC11]